MVLVMSRPYKHPKTGVYWLRKVVPVRLRPIVGKRELKASLKTKEPSAAREAAAPLMVQFNAVIAAAEDEKRGTAAPPSPRRVAELCGHWYHREVARLEDKPLSVPKWDDRLDYYLGMFVAPDDPRDHSPREFMPDRQVLREAEEFLRAEGVAATRPAIRAMAEGLAHAHIQFAQAMLRHARGDCSPDPALARFPQPTQRPSGVTSHPGSKVSFTDLVTTWAAENGRVGKPLYERQRTAAAFATFLGHDDATRVTPEDAVRWKEARLAAGRSVKTVGGDLGALRPIWTWAKANRKLSFSENPFAGISPRERRTSVRSRIAYSEDDARRVLEAAREAKGYLRWLPWLLCFTGARLGEACQSEREDIQRQGADGPWFLRVHEDGPGRTLKTPQSARMIPLHPALIAEGFLAYVTALPAASPLWPDMARDLFGRRIGTATKRHGRWLRQTVKITDARIDPAHGWRHRFEEQAQRAGLPQNVTDALMGHLSSQNESATYGRGLGFMPEVTAPWVEKMASPFAAE